MHVAKAIESTVKMLLKIYDEKKEAVHGAVWGDWYVGKTKSALKLLKKNKDVRYMKFPEYRLTDSQFMGQLVLALGYPPRRSFAENFDIAIEVFAAKKARLVLVIDEAQRLFAKKRFLSILKDLVERIEVEYPAGLLLLFLGDKTLSKFITPHYHSLVKRILIRKPLEPITEETIMEIALKYSVEIKEVKEIAKILKKDDITTGELDTALYLAAKKGIKEAGIKELENFISAAVEGIK